MRIATSSQRAQKSHRKPWDRSKIRCHMEKELGARGVKAGDLHADSQPSVFPPPQVGTAPYVPVKKGSATSLILLPSSPTVPDSSTRAQSTGLVLRHTQQDLLQILHWGKGREALGGAGVCVCGGDTAICSSRAGREEVWRFHAWVKLQSVDPLRDTWHSYLCRCPLKG